MIPEKTTFLPAQVQVIRIGSRNDLSLAHSVHPHKLVWIFGWKRAQEKAINHTEDASVKPDAEGERQERHGCEARAPCQQAQAVAQILD